jgi:hypothetical protein
MKGTISMDLHQFFAYYDLDFQTKESKALIPYSIKNHILESPSPWVTIDLRIQDFKFQSIIFVLD